MEYLREKKNSKWRLINVILQESELSNTTLASTKTTLTSESTTFTPSTTRTTSTSSTRRTTSTSSTRRTTSSSQFKTFNCGEPSYQPFLKRIINGQQALDNSWPWMVQLFTNKFICGVSIIGPNRVITAAHCVKDFRAENIFLVYRTNNLQDLPNRNVTMQ
ncbi:unnamed protein product [Brachionus calyciflorus]|uniref:Peptidase S1 domain-containing protein n=1 Tax=Brachionus calyciflorus TaxID=104777 RepID=A0A814MQF3_9BILA|nr:unnamed protein product [Brachionus calyciflorus]